MLGTAKKFVPTMKGTLGWVLPPGERTSLGDVQSSLTIVTYRKALSNPSDIKVNSDWPLGVTEVCTSYVLYVLP